MGITGKDRLAQVTGAAMAVMAIKALPADPLPATVAAGTAAAVTAIEIGIAVTGTAPLPQLSRVLHLSHTLKTDRIIQVIRGISGVGTIGDNAADRWRSLPNQNFTWYNAAIR